MMVGRPFKPLVYTGHLSSESNVGLKNDSMLLREMVLEGFQPRAADLLILITPSGFPPSPSITSESDHN